MLWKHCWLLCWIAIWTSDKQQELLKITILTAFECTDTPFQSFFATDKSHHHPVLAFSLCLNKSLMHPGWYSVYLLMLWFPHMLIHCIYISTVGWPYLRINEWGVSWHRSLTATGIEDKQNTNSYCYAMLPSSQTIVYSFKFIVVIITNNTGVHM